MPKSVDYDRARSTLIIAYSTASSAARSEDRATSVRVGALTTAGLTR